MLKPGDVVLIASHGANAVPMVVKSVGDGMCLCYWIDSRSFGISSCQVMEERLVLLSDRLKDSRAVEEIEEDNNKSSCSRCNGSGFIKVKSGKIIDKWPCPECKDD